MRYLSVRSVVLSRVLSIVVLLCILLAWCDLEPAVTPTTVQPSPPFVGQVTAVIEPTVLPTASPEPAADTPTMTRPPATATAVPPTATVTPSPLPPSRTPTYTPVPTAVPVVVTETPPPFTAEPPRITFFTVTPARASQGDTITLNWESEGGVWAEICTTVNQGYPDRYSCDEVSPTGSKVVVVEPDATIYHLQLKVSNGEYAAFHDVYGCIDVSDWFFENPPDSCAAAPPVHSYAAAQRFEHGLMVWLEASDEFMVFFDDNTFRIFYPPLDLKPGASADNRVGGAPAGYFEPVSGFGLIWRGEVEYSENMRSILGWALEPEFGFETTYQSGILTNWHYLDRYMRDPEGRIIYLSTSAYIGSWWRYWEN